MPTAACEWSLSVETGGDIDMTAEEQQRFYLLAEIRAW
jgi:hypothetical protein